MIKRRKPNEGAFESLVGHWKDLMSGIAASFLGNITDFLAEKIRLEADNLYVSLQRNIVGLFMILFGLAFVFVGLAIFLNELIAISDGMGYAIVGLLTLFVGLIIIKRKNNG